ncbi:MAG: hypothetical protein LKF52_01835 [Butyrivibrio sp.]|jgi:hypothetical protein|nr:hypothetical protein [Butyrivibrio sp.]
MRKIVYKSKAVQAVIAILALIAILMIWPVRMWSTTWTGVSGGAIAGESGTIDSTHDMVQKFMAQYGCIGSVDVYVTQVMAGRYLQAGLYDQNMQPVYDTLVDMGTEEIPGYIRVPMKVSLKAGEQYTLLITPMNASFKVAYEDIPASVSPYILETAYQDTAVEGYHLAARYNYILPLGWQASVAAVAAVIAAAVLLTLLTGVFYRRNPDRNHRIAVRRAVRYTLNPICAALLGAMMIMVFPLKLFDDRPADILFYELGLVITALLVFYGINHRRSETDAHLLSNFKSPFATVKAIGQMAAIALAVKFGCEYMNALYDIYHTLAERKQMICLLCLIILTFSAKELLNRYNAVYLIAATASGVYFYFVNRLAVTEKEYNLHNAALTYGIVIAVLGGMIAINLLMLLISAVMAAHAGEKKRKPVRLSLFGILLAVFFAVIVIMRNTRWWGVALAVTYTVFYLRFYVWKEKKQWLDILSGGLMLNFIGSWIYCILFRYFAGFVSARFSFVFHTVTVTAEYLTFMECTAAVLLLSALYRQKRGCSFRKLAEGVWKEFILFGMVTAYVIFTMSRTAYLAVGASCLILLLMVVRGRGSVRTGFFFRNLLICIMAAVICFPAAFALQRLVPAVVGKPYIFTIEDTVTDLRGGAEWDSRSFMCVERFEAMFMEKILGMGGMSYNYPRDRYNYDSNGNLIYGPDGEPVTADASAKAVNLFASMRLTGDEKMLLVSAQDAAGTSDSGAADNTQSSESGLDEFSNGRFTIFGAYLSQMNLTGHEQMGATLPDGEVAVHAHNTYLQVAYDHGVPAGILFIVVIFAALAAGFVYDEKMGKRRRISALPMAITLGFAVAGLTEWVFQFSNPMTIALMLSFAPLIYSSKSERLS